MSLIICAPYLVSTVAQAAGDPFESNIVFLSHMEDPVYDVAGHTITIGSSGAYTASPTTAAYKFGERSLAINGGNAYSPPSQDFILNDAFTIECWVRQTASTGATANTIFTLGHYTNGILLRNHLAEAFFVNGAYASTPTLYFPHDGSWHHIAVVRQAGSSTVTLYVDGQSRNTITMAAPINTIGGGFLIGQSSHAAEGMTGNIDEVCITKAARYTGNFTPPSVPYP